VEKFRLSDDEAAESVNLTRKTGRMVKVTSKIEAVAEDPDDDKFLEAAVSSGAKVIVSGDHHLLELQAYQGIKIIKANEFLQQVLMESEEA
jgi:predicted nucleic acid-binding protein